MNSDAGDQGKALSRGRGLHFYIRRGPQLPQFVITEIVIHETSRFWAQMTPALLVKHLLYLVSLLVTRCDFSSLVVVVLIVAPSRTLGTLRHHANKPQVDLTFNLTTGSTLPSAIIKHRSHSCPTWSSLQRNDMLRCTQTGRAASSAQAEGLWGRGPLRKRPKLVRRYRIDITYCYRQQAEASRGTSRASIKRN